MGVKTYENKGLKPWRPQTRVFGKSKIKTKFGKGGENGIKRG
jgi:hypothetical protein